MKLYISFYQLYTSALGRTARLLVFVLICSLIFTSFMNQYFSELSFFYLNLFIMMEIFFHYKIAHVHPRISVNESKNLAESSTLFVLKSLVGKERGLHFLLKIPQVQFILLRSGIARKEITWYDVPEKDLLKRACEVAQSCNGIFITSMDLIGAYLLLTEERSQLLFSKNVKEEDLFSILSWARNMYPSEEKAFSLRVQFTGGGIGEDIVSGWTPATKQYTKDMWSRVQNFPSRPSLIGREKVFEQLLEVLTKPEQNNVLLRGEAGVGKENLVKVFTYSTKEGVLGEKLNYKKVLEVLIGPLVAGAANRSELEVRLQNIIEEVSHAENIVLYLPEIETILGSSSYGLNLSEALLPYLQNGTMPVIATISNKNYKKYMEDSTLAEVFTTITLEEPASDIALQMLCEKVIEIEREMSVTFTFTAIKSAVQFAAQFSPDYSLPGSGSKLLQESASTAINTAEKEKNNAILVTDKDIISTVERQSHVRLSSPQGEERELLLHLEEKLHERVIGQDIALSGVSQAIRRIRTSTEPSRKPISFLFLGPTGVGKTETARSLADMYYCGEKQMIRLDMSEYIGEDGIRRLLGDGEQRGELTEKIHDHPSALVLLDEFEKADQLVLNLLLQVLEDGRLTDNRGKTVSFTNCLLIATSNAGSEFIRQSVLSGDLEPAVFRSQLLDHLQQNTVFKPELLNRFDDIITFLPLNREQLAQVAQLLLVSLQKKFLSRDITLAFDESVIKQVVEKGSDVQFGARPIKRYLQNTIEDALSKMTLQEALIRGDVVTFSLSEAGELEPTVQHRRI